MHSELDWSELLFLNSLNGHAAYLKMMSFMYDIEIRLIVEIGVYHGENSKWLHTLFPEASLFLIDSWNIYEKYLSMQAGTIAITQIDYEKAFQSLQQNLVHDPKTHIIQKTFKKAIHLVPRNIDLVFIDANHIYSFVKQDIESWFPKHRKGSLILKYDYNLKHFPDVAQTVDEFFKEGFSIGGGHTWLKCKP